MAREVVLTEHGKLHLLRVFVEPGEDADTVVTAYWTSKVRKYWREE